jgi:hypothetical protein
LSLGVKNADEAIVLLTTMQKNVCDVNDAAQLFKSLPAKAKGYSLVKAWRLLINCFRNWQKMKKRPAPQSGMNKTDRNKSLNGSAKCKKPIYMCINK